MRVRVRVSYYPRLGAHLQASGVGARGAEPLSRQRWVGGGGASCLVRVVGWGWGWGFRVTDRFRVTAKARVRVRVTLRICQSQS